MDAEQLIIWANNEKVQNERRLELMDYKDKNPLILSYCYFTGDGLPQNIEKAIEYRLNHSYVSKNHEHPYSTDTYLELGNCYYVLGNYDKAIESYQRAVELNGKNDNFKRFITDRFLDEIKICLDYIQKGRTLSKDKICIAELSRLALKGNSLAQLQAAIFYFNLSLSTGYGERRKAAMWFRKLAEKGDPEAQCYLGICYYNYKGVCSNIDCAEALKWLSKSANRGNRDALYFLGSLLESHKELIIKKGFNKYDLDKYIIECYVLSANLGNILALKYLWSYRSISGVLNRDSDKDLINQVKIIQRPDYNEAKLIENGDPYMQHQKIWGDYRYHKSKNYTDIKKWISIFKSNPRRKIFYPLIDEIEGMIAYDEGDYASALMYFTKVLKHFGVTDDNHLSSSINDRTYAYLGNIYYYGKGTVKDEEKAKKYYLKIFSDTFKSAEEQKEKFGLEACETWEKIKPVQKGGCYITTATCNSLGVKDDCYELNLFRNYRDNWVRSQIDGQQLINEYYRVAPIIVKNINTMADSKVVYQKIWDNYLTKCVSLIEQKKFNECKVIYVKMVLHLKDRYLY